MRYFDPQVDSFSRESADRRRFLGHGFDAQRWQNKNDSREEGFSLMSHRKAVTQVLALGSYVPPRANGGTHSRLAATNWCHRSHDFLHELRDCGRNRQSFTWEEYRSRCSRTRVEMASGQPQRTIAVGAPSRRARKPGRPLVLLPRPPHRARDAGFHHAALRRVECFALRARALP